jgi:glucokinase
MTMPAVLGIDIGGTKISLCVAAMSGKVVASRRIETRSGDGAPVVLDRLASAARGLVRQVLEEHRADVRGVGVVTPGVVEAHAVRLAPNNEGWEAVALTATVSERLGLAAVEADNDAKAATAAEAHWGALAGVTDGILLNLGTGISAGAVVGGRPLRGGHGAALEIAYQVPSAGVVHGFVEGSAPLEARFSGAGLAASASAALGRRTGTDEVFAAMRAARRGGGAGAAVSRDDEALAALGEQALDLAARAVANLAIALDPEVVALSGGMLRSADVITPTLASALADLVPFPPRLVRAHFAEHAPLAGACLAAYGAAGADPPARLDLGSGAGAAPLHSSAAAARPGSRPATLKE